MNILLLGGGGREHALAWALAQSPSCTRLFAAPGNPGIAQSAEVVALDTGDHAAVIAFAKGEAIDLVVVGPEAPLIDGIADRLTAAGIATFGPSQAAAQLEGSKNFTKALCAAHGIPTAAYAFFDDKSAALAAVDAFGLPVVVKADGLAAGKGVTIAETRAEAEAALADIFRSPGGAVVIEAFLIGEEVSLFVVSDGTRCLSFGTAQDHKRVGEGDTGPNTGGMGAYSPASVLTPALEAQAMREIVEPTIAAMVTAGTPFVGVLYAGLMLTDTGPQLIEYNVRLGDPEAQVLLPRFEGDLAALFHAAATGDLRGQDVGFSERYAVGVVLAAQGYPASPLTGGQIAGAQSGDTLVFIAGAVERNGALVASGGRVLTAVGLAGTVTQACNDAYAAIEQIDFVDGFYRRDIAWREIARCVEIDGSASRSRRRSA